MKYKVEYDGYMSRVAPCRDDDERASSFQEAKMELVKYLRDQRDSWTWAASDAWHLTQAQVDHEYHFQKVLREE